MTTAPAPWISATNPRVLARNGITCSIPTAQKAMAQLHHETCMVARIHGASESDALRKANRVACLAPNRAGDHVWHIHRDHVAELETLLAQEKQWLSTTHGQALATHGITSSASTVQAASHRLYESLSTPHRARGLRPDMTEFLVSRKGIRTGTSLWGNSVYQIHPKALPLLRKEIATIAGQRTDPSWVNARNHSRLLQDFGIHSKSTIVESICADIYARDVAAWAEKPGITEAIARQKVAEYLRPARTESGERSWAIRTDYLAHIAFSLRFDPRQSDAWLSPASDHWQALGLRAGRPVIQRAMQQLQQSPVLYEAQMVREGIAQGGKPVLKAHINAAPLLQAIIESMPNRAPYSDGKSSSRPSR